MSGADDRVKGPESPAGTVLTGETRISTATGFVILLAMLMLFLFFLFVPGTQQEERLQQVVAEEFHALARQHESQIGQLRSEVAALRNTRRASQLREVLPLLEELAKEGGDPGTRAAKVHREMVELLGALPQ